MMPSQGRAFRCATHHHRKRRTHDDHGDGFSLIEVVVALVVFSSVFLALYRGIAGGGRAIRQANMEGAATDLATSKLAAAGIETTLGDQQSYAGDDGRFTWRMRVERSIPPAVQSGFQSSFESATPSTLMAYWVDIEVSWRPGVLEKSRVLHFRTLKLARRP